MFLHKSLLTYIVHHLILLAGLEKGIDGNGKEHGSHYSIYGALV